MDPLLFISCLCLGIAAAVISVTVIVIMPLEPILNWWFRIGEKYGKRTANGYELERWFYRPIWGCEKCFAGQLGLWGYLLAHIRAQGGQNGHISGINVGWPTMAGYSLFCHLLTVSAAIMAAVIISSFIKSKTTHESD